jgi:hypothetical protein
MEERLVRPLILGPAMCRVYILMFLIAQSEIWTTDPGRLHSVETL